jgi:uncharacterized phage protein (TIGR01671 family)
MSREIKFRGVCAISKDIVHGDLIHGVGAKSNYVYILPNRANLAGVKHCDPLDGVKVLPESVGQYTGLKDKDGKEIYEGDLLHRHMGVYWQVAFVNSSWIGKSLIDSGIYLSASQFIETEIIGNIYENPELLP